MPAPGTQPGIRPGSAQRRKKALQVAAVVLLIIAASTGGAFYYLRYGDTTSEDFHAIWDTTKDLLKIDVPARLHPRLLIERPDVMTMVIYATKDGTAEGREACLAIIRTRPEWVHEQDNSERGHPTGRLLRSVLEQYCPQFETERWTGVQEREISVRGISRPVKIASSFRVYDHQEVRIVSLDGLSTEKGTVAVYYQSAVDSLTDDEVDLLLKSLQ